jgi:uncharacterized phage infection (PIP) family protein YhgE
MPEEAVSEDNLFDVDASIEEESIEVAPETLAELKEAGVDTSSIEPPSTEESEEIVASETDEAPAEQEHPPVEPEGEAQEETPLIAGKYKTQDDLVKGYEEAQRKLHEQAQSGQRLGELEGAFDVMTKDPEGAKLIMRVMSGQPAQPQGPQIPTGELFDEWLGKNLEGNLGQFVDHRSQQIGGEVAQLRAQIGQMYAYLENQATVQRHGDTLNDLQPYIEQVSQELGQNAQYYPREQLILMAEGTRAREAAATTATQEQTTKQQEQAKQDHRGKVIAASVEPANGTAKVAPKIVNTDDMTIDELEAFIISQGAKVVTHD